MIFTLVLANDYASASPNHYNAPVPSSEYHGRKYPVPESEMTNPEPISEAEHRYYTPEPQATNLYSPFPQPEGHNEPEHVKPESEHVAEPEHESNPIPEIAPTHDNGYQYKEPDSVQPESHEESPNPEPTKSTPAYPEPAQESAPCENEEVSPIAEQYQPGNAYASPAKSTQYSDTYTASASSASIIISFVSIHLLQ